MNISEIKNNEERLVALKRGILSRRNLLSKDKERISHPYPESLDDQATASENDEVIDELDMQDSLELRDINDALTRVKDGSFGICISCGDEISKQRLKAMPYAENCIECENGDE